MKSVCQTLDLNQQPSVPIQSILIHTPPQVSNISFIHKKHEVRWVFCVSSHLQSCGFHSTHLCSIYLWLLKYSCDFYGKYGKARCEPIVFVVGQHPIQTGPCLAPCRSQDRLQASPQPCLHKQLWIIDMCGILSKYLNFKGGYEVPIIVSQKKQTTEK